MVPPMAAAFAGNLLMNGSETMSREEIAKRFEKLVNKSGAPYFVLKAGNSQVIGQSQAYGSDAARDAGIAAVGAAADGAATSDLSG